MSKNKKYIITSIDFKKKEIIVKYLDDTEEKEIYLYPSVYSDFYLYNGKIIESEEFKLIQEKNILAKYFDIAYKLISKKEYSSGLLKKRLIEKEINEGYIEKIIITLKEQGLIDDERYAYDYKESLDFRLYGKNYIIKLLKEAGIEDKYINNIEFNNEEEKINKLIAILIKKREKESYLVMKKHLYQDLYLRGYDSELINETIALIEGYDQDKEYDNCLRDFQKYNRIYQSKYSKKELRPRIISSLMRKGYSYDIIKKVVEEQVDE